MAPHATSPPGGSPPSTPAKNTDTTDPAALPSVLDELPIELPQVDLPADTDHAAIGVAFASRLHQHGLKQSDLQPGSIWRDLFALTGSTHTYYGLAQLWPVWERCSTHRQAGAFAATPVETSVTRAPHACTSWVEVVLRFQTAQVPQTECLLVAQLVPAGDDWVVWCMSTVLDGLVGQPSVHHLAPSPRTGPLPKTSDYEAVVVGGGPAGLCVAGRLQALGVRYLLIDAHAAVGDSWRTRYDSMQLHTMREYAHLPFERTFGPNQPEWLSKHDLADGYQAWTQRYGIAIQLSSRLRHGTWDGARYTLHIDRPSGRQTLTTPNVVFAVGQCSQGAYTPSIPDRALYTGTTLHSGDYTSAAPWTSKRGIVIGAANTAHDIASDMAAAGMPVTLVQRGRTWLLPRHWYQAGVASLYNATRLTALADRARFALPHGVATRLTSTALFARARADPHLHDAVEAAGLRVRRDGDLAAHVYGRAGGHYLDTGSCARILAGAIAVRDGSAGYRFTPAGLVFADGSVVDADVVVFATGFRRSVEDAARRVFGDALADRLEPFWGLDAEGEVRGAWRPQGQPGFWMVGGELGSARYFSGLVALQVRARGLGTALPVLGRDF